MVGVQREFDGVNGRSMSANQNDWRSIDALTERQRAVVRSICDGKGNKEIGLDLGISPQTVKNHVTMILGRTGSNDRSRLAYLFARWEDVQRATPVESQVEAPLTDGDSVSFRVLAANRLLIRLGRRNGESELIELTESVSQQLRTLLLANISDDGFTVSETP